MRVGFGQFREASSEYLRFAVQYGATDVLFNNPALPTANPAAIEPKPNARPAAINLAASGSLGKNPPLSKLVDSDAPNTGIGANITLIIEITSNGFPNAGLSS